MDKIRITRRIALEKYEYYQLEITPDINDFEGAIDQMEAWVALVRNEMKIPSPEISPKLVEDYTGVKQRTPIALQKPDDPYDHLLTFDGNTVRTKQYLKDEKWKEINTYLKEQGYKWVSAGKDSRWER